MKGIVYSGSGIGEQQLIAEVWGTNATTARMGA